MLLWNIREVCLAWCEVSMLDVTCLCGVAAAFEAAQSGDLRRAVKEATKLRGVRVSGVPAAP